MKQSSQLLLSTLLVVAAVVIFLSVPTEVHADERGGGIAYCIWESKTYSQGACLATPCNEFGDLVLKCFADGWLCVYC